MTDLIGQCLPEPPSFPVRLLFATSLGSLAILFGAVAWSLLLFFSNSIYQMVAFLIGWAIAVAALLPLRPIRKRYTLAFLPLMIASALLSLILGVLLFYMLYELRQFEATLTEAVLDSVRHWRNMFSLPEMNWSFGLGALGAVLGFLIVPTYPPEASPESPPAVPSPANTGE
jgi:hypothetical protein